MAAISGLCHRAVLFDSGIVDFDGFSDLAVSRYLTRGVETVTLWKNDILDGDFFFNDCRIVATSKGHDLIKAHSGIDIHLSFTQRKDLKHSVVFVRVEDMSGHTIFTSWDSDCDQQRSPLREAGHYEALCSIPPNLLACGRHSVTIGAHIPRVRVLALNKTVVSFDISTAGRLTNDERAGIICPILKWSVEQVEGNGGSSI